MAFAYAGKRMGQTSCTRRRVFAEVRNRLARLCKTARTIPSEDRIEPDPAVVNLLNHDRETQEWLGRAIGESEVALTAKEARFRDTAILDLIQKVQLEAGNADVSMVASFNSEARIAKGPVTVRDIAGLYVYENTLVVLEVTGQQLKDALEHSAKYFKSYVPGKPPQTNRRKDSGLQFRHRGRCHLRSRYFKTNRTTNTES